MQCLPGAQVLLWHEIRHEIKLKNEALHTALGNKHTSAHAIFYSKAYKPLIQLDKTSVLRIQIAPFVTDF